MQDFKSKFFYYPHTTDLYQLPNCCYKPAAKGFSSYNPGKVCSALPHKVLGVWCHPGERGRMQYPAHGAPQCPVCFSNWCQILAGGLKFICTTSSRSFSFQCHEGCFHLKHVLLCYCLTQSSVLLHFSMLNHLGPFLLEHRENPALLSKLLAIILHTEDLLCKGSSGSTWGTSKEQDHKSS